VGAFAARGLAVCEAASGLGFAAGFFLAGLDFGGDLRGFFAAMRDSVANAATWLSAAT